MSAKEKKCVEKLPKYKLAKSLKPFSLEYGIDEKDIIKLAGNENRYGCSKKVLDVIENTKSEFSYYPDMNVSLLRERLSEKHNINPDNLIFGNG